MEKDTTKTADKTRRSNRRLVTSTRIAVLLFGALGGAIVVCTGTSISKSGSPTVICPDIVPDALNSLSYVTKEHVKVKRVGHDGLVASTNRGSIDLSASQADYGVIRNISDTKTGDIAIIGDQTSYIIRIKTADGVPKIISNERLPTLYREECWLISRIFDLCHVRSASYSRTLRAIFLDGNSRGGQFSSLVFGLSDSPLQLTRAAYPYYAGDISNDRVLLRQRVQGRLTGAAIFDGRHPPTPCYLSISES